MSQFLPTGLSPEFTTIDPTIDNDFEWVPQGAAQTAFRLYIYKNSDNSLIYDSTKITSTTSSHTVPASTLTANTAYKWKVTVFAGTPSIDSEYVFFIANTAPSVTLSVPATITNQNYTFTATYTLATGASIEKFKFILYDDASEIVDDTDYIYSYNTTYTFTGLVNLQSYSIECIITDSNGLTGTSGAQAFTVSYTVPNTIPLLTVTPDNDNGYIQLNWSDIIQITAVATGSVSFTTGKYLQGALIPDSASNIVATQTIPIGFTFSYWVKLPTGFYGDFLSLGTDEYVVGYDGSRFYYTCQGFMAAQSAVMPTDFFFVGITHLYVYIITSTYTITLG
jgi:hypothetical protein